jgi:parallel beta-helix repeat protein/predicted outer membrane repeat protein
MTRPPLSFRPRLESLEDRAVPATFNVTAFGDNLTPGDGKRTLREAINMANSTAGTDTVVLPAGVFRITIDGRNEDANATGDFDITEDIVVRGAGAGLTVLNAQGKDRLFETHGSITARFVGMTLRRGDALPNVGLQSGGAIGAQAGNIVILNCTLSDNRANQGGAVTGSSNASVTLTGSTVTRNVAFGEGAIFSLNGIITVTSSTISRNLAGNSGGGLFSFGDVTVTGSTISGNSSASFCGGVRGDDVTITNSTISGNSSINGAGGVQALSSLTLTGSTVKGNSTNGDGGGLHIGSNLATIRRSTITGNFAAVDGGGIFAGSVDATASTFSGNSAGRHGGGIESTEATLTRSTVSGNFSRNGNGGGLRAQTATLTNSTFSGNTANNGNGGGIALHTGGGGAIRNCTVYENLARGSGGGIWRDAASTDPVGIINTIVARNAVVFSAPDVSGEFASLGSNLIGDTTGSTGFLLVGDLFGLPGNPLDPKLGPLAGNGGPTRTHALLPGSLAIDNGNDSLAPATDQRGAGFPRQKDGNGDGIARVDIGAFER